MKTAIVCLCTGDYWRGAKGLFHTLAKYGKLPDSIDRIALGKTDCSFATPIPINKDYGWINVNHKHFPKVADKFHALTLPYDRIILIDADMLCVGNCSYLWGEQIGRLAFYGCRDYASEIYYKDQIEKINLNPDLLFNAGTLVFQMDLLPNFYENILKLIENQTLQAYDGGDQGYLNHYFQYFHSDKFGFLPFEYNCCLDKFMPELRPESKRLIHFTGGNANPWKPKMIRTDWRLEYVKRWEKEWKSANR